MIEHIVIIKWKEDTPQKIRDEILNELSHLPSIIPGIASYKVGHNVSSRGQGFGAGITSTFADHKALDAYIIHPEHQKVSAKLQQYSENLIAIDFEAIPRGH